MGLLLSRHAQNVSLSLHSSQTSLWSSLVPLHTCPGAHTCSRERTEDFTCSSSPSPAFDGPAGAFSTGKLISLADPLPGRGSGCSASAGSGKPCRQAGAAQPWPSSPAPGQVDSTTLAPPRSQHGRLPACSWSGANLGMRMEQVCTQPCAWYKCACNPMHVCGTGVHASWCMCMEQVSMQPCV